MNKIKDKKIIGLLLLLGIIVILSIVTYVKNKQYIFRDQYEDKIFVEEEISESDDKEVVVSEKKSESTIIVEIKGEVVNPDVYEVPEDSIVKDLIDKAGGLTDKASIDKINRAEQLHNHQLIIISNIEEINNSPTQAISSNFNSGDILININTATADELQNIPGIGEAKAQSIISYREENGDFKSIEDIMNVSGIGEKSFEKMKDKITI